MDFDEPVPTNAATNCITCGICFNILHDPVSLHCEHSFCLQCIRAKLEKVGPNEGTLCPLCNTLHADIGLRNLTEFINQRLIDRIAMLNKGADARPICQWCEEAPAMLHCPECMYALCTDCNVAVHKNAAKRSHQPVTLSDSRSIKATSKKCGQRGHEEYRLEFYCVRCEALCCAYCLQVGPHRGHDSILVSKAAQEVRQQMGRDLENLGQVKARIEGMASELNRIHGQYLETYDHVESLITDRFNAFKQQLIKKEVEVRRILTSLRETGDASLAESRHQYLRKLNAINEAGMQYRRLQHGGADYEVLQNRATMSAFLKSDVPSVTGTGFRLSDLGDLNLAGLAISLDLTSSGVNQATIRSASAAATGELPMQRRAVQRFTFPEDRDVEVHEHGDGLLFRCSEHASVQQVGFRANETFEMLRDTWQEEGGLISWRVRLDYVADTFLGIVEGQNSSTMPDGFYWRPMRQGHHDGKLGRATQAVRSLPVCRNGDIVKLTFDINAKVLKVAINNIDRGIIATDLHTHLAPCFIFRPGEALTLLY